MRDFTECDFDIHWVGFNVIVTVSGVAESQTVQVGVNKNGEMVGTVELSEHQATGIVPSKFLYDSEYEAFIKVTPTGHECQVTNPTGTVYNHHIIYVVCTFSNYKSFFTKLFKCFFKKHHPY